LRIESGKLRVKKEGVKGAKGLNNGGEMKETGKN